MKLDVKQERENPHLKRKELQIFIDHEGQSTPTKASLQQLVSKQFGHELTRTDIRGIYTESGTAKSHAKVFIWIEKEVKDLSKKEEKAEEKSAEKKEEPKQEKPKEAPKKEETPKKEEKPAEKKEVKGENKE